MFAVQFGAARAPIGAVALAIASVLPATDDVAAQSLTGQWTETTRSTDATVHSWGGNCPERPQSSSSRPNLPVEIVVEGDHLQFPRGRRTDRCWSDNPALRRIRFSKQGNRYVIECRTPDDDSRQEHGTYVVTVEPERIAIELRSEYDWILNQDRCRATLVERRVLARSLPRAADAGTPDADLRNPFQPDAGEAATAATDALFPRLGLARPLPPEPAQPEPRACERPGPPVRLRIRGPRAVSPGDRVMLTARRVDRSDCDLGPAQARFHVAGSGTGGTVTPDGLFRACDSVAMCDGERVRIEATAEVLSGSTVILVAANIERGLGTVGAVEGEAGEQPEGEGGPAGAQVATALLAQGGKPAAGAGVAVTPSPAAEPASSWMLWLVVIGGALVVVAVAAYLIVSMRRPAPAPGDALAAEPPAFVLAPAPPQAGPRPPAPEPLAAAPPPPQAVPRPPAPPKWHCPACRREYDSAGHCPADGLATTEGAAPPPARTVEYVACPRCGRGRSKDAKFCPDDKELLLPYGMAVTEYRARRRGETAPAEKVCPRCGARSPGSALFCAKDGEALRP